GGRCPDVSVAARRRPCRQGRSQPAAPLEPGVQHDRQQQHRRDRSRVAERPVELGHVGEVHAVDPRNERRSQQNRAPTSYYRSTMTSRNAQIRNPSSCPDSVVRSSSNLRATVSRSKGAGCPTSSLTWRTDNSHPSPKTRSISRVTSLSSTR